MVKPSCTCGSDLFYFASRFMICYQCKERYEKHRFLGTVIKTVSNKDRSHNPLNVMENRET